MLPPRRGLGVSLSIADPDRFQVPLPYVFPVQVGSA